MKVYYARNTKDMRVVQSDGAVVFYILEKYTLGIHMHNIKAFKAILLYCNQCCVSGMIYSDLNPNTK